MDATPDDNTETVQAFVQYLESIIGTFRFEHGETPTVAGAGNDLVPGSYRHAISAHLWARYDTLLSAADTDDSYWILGGPSEGEERFSVQGWWSPHLGVGQLEVYSCLRKDGTDPARARDLAVLIP